MCVLKKCKGKEKMFVLFTDTDTDMTPQVAAEYGYNLISMPYTMDGKEFFPYEDFEEFEAHEFYEKLRKGATPKTSGLSPEKYMNYFEPFFKEGKDILYVHFSASMSGTFDSMKIAIKELKEKYPERNLYTIDTKGITMCSYAIARDIGELYKAGKTVEEIQEWAKEEIDKYAAYFFVENLSFFRRSGRVKSFAAFMGNILGIRPIIYIDKEGTMTSIDKAKGKHSTISKIMSYVEKLQDNIKDHRVVIAHSDAPETAKMLGDKVKAMFGDDINIEYIMVNPTSGSHCGPDGVGICFHAIHR